LPLYKVDLRVFES